MVVSRLSNHTIKNHFYYVCIIFLPSRGSYNPHIATNHWKRTLNFTSRFFNSKASSISSPPFEIVIFESNSACKFIFS